MEPDNPLAQSNPSPSPEVAPSTASETSSPTSSTTDDFAAPATAPTPELAAEPEPAAAAKRQTVTPEPDPGDLAGTATLVVDLAVGAVFGPPPPAEEPIAGLSAMEREMFHHALGRLLSKYDVGSFAYEEEVEFLAVSTGIVYRRIAARRRAARVREERPVPAPTQPAATSSAPSTAPRPSISGFV